MNANDITLTQVKQMVDAKELRQMHTALTRGYVSRKTKGTVVPYSGKFGEGFVAYTPNWDSTRYCFVTYYVK
jgi:hypothetical protein